MLAVNKEMEFAKIILFKLYLFSHPARSYANFRCYAKHARKNLTTPFYVRIVLFRQANECKNVICFVCTCEKMRAITYNFPEQKRL